MGAALLGLLALLLHLALVLVAAPVLTDAGRRVQGRLLGEAGPALRQTLWDFARLARKETLWPEGAGAVFLAGPVVDFAASLAAAALVPGFAHGMATAPAADLLLFAGLLLLARVARALAALAAGTASGGVAASEAMTRAALAAPAVLLVIFALTLATGTSNIDAIAAQPGTGSAAPRALAFAALALAAFALTREEAGLRTDQSGWSLALSDWASALRRLAWLALIAALMLPWGMAPAAAQPLLWVVAVPLWGVKLAALAVLLAVAETVTAPPALPRLLGVAAVLAGVAVVLICAGPGAA